MITYPTARPKGGKLHAVYADGGPKDGSLHATFTLCGLYVDDGAPNARWAEETNKPIECATCRRLIAEGVDL